MADNIDLEAGLNPQMLRFEPHISADPLSNPDPNLQSNPDVRKSAMERLNLFRTLVGIQSVMPEAELKRPAPNIGVYHRVVKTLSERRIQYYATSLFINFCLFGQIILGAALTALGAAAGSHISIAVLGSFNTIIAGVMTYLKGQGLPDRLREDANELRRVREYLEQIERQLMAEDPNITPEREAKLIYDMYNEVRKNAENNVSSNPKSVDLAKVQKHAAKLEKAKDALVKVFGGSDGPHPSTTDKGGPHGSEDVSSSAHK